MGKKVYSQNQETYVVCLDPVSWNSSINSPSSQNQLDDDMDPLEQLLQSSIKNCKSNNQKKATTIFERRNFNWMEKKSIKGN